MGHYAWAMVDRVRGVENLRGRGFGAIGGAIALCALVCIAAPGARACMAQVASALPGKSTWHDGLSWQGKTAWVAVRPDGKYVLHSPAGVRVIAAQRWRVQTGSLLFDALFAMAQEDLERDSVNAITDPAFDDGRPIPCRCFVAGEKWPFVWTRDVSYSIDLGLWRLDPARARNSLLFKLSPPRAGPAPSGLYVMQDTGSGGSWPVSTDRVVWFLGARHLLADHAFADTIYQALTDTLAQDRRYVFDSRVGLYRGETSFLDWREQTYPAWTAHNVVFIAQSFALSTNVLHFEALQLAAAMARERGETNAGARYASQADSLKTAINTRFWRSDRGLYMSYIGGPGDPQPFDAYDLLGLDLAITSGVADSRRAAESLEHYPAWPAGSPVIWPERRDQPIYHNRAIWPFVSDYTLRAARRVGDPSLIALEVRSLMRGAALYASNMENYSLLSQSTRVPGKLGGPVVDSRRQLWSVAGYLDMVVRGVFGLKDDGSVVPELPGSLLPTLFGTTDRIRLDLDGREIILERPTGASGPLLVAGPVRHHGHTTEVQLVPAAAAAVPPPMDAPLYAAAPPAPLPRPVAPLLGRAARVAGSWPRHWTTPRRGAAGAITTGSYLAWLDYSNPHGPINTGITAAVRRLEVHCAGNKPEVLPVVMPHSDGWQASTSARFEAHAGASCTFSLLQGFNMSDLAQFAHYTGSAAARAPNGGASGPLNRAQIGALRIAPLPAGSKATP
jgi:Bacterial alpha-L-rhamnosidase 6 hairpin glycosidase domain